MAAWTAIRTISDALQAVLEAARVGTSFAALPITVYQTGNFASPQQEEVSIYLYRVALHGAMRNLPQRQAADGKRYRPSLPVDLHYLVTPWARSASRQQDLLGWLIRALEDQPVLSAALLNQPALLAGGPEVFAPNEVIDIIAQPLSPQEMVAVWEFNKAAMQPSMTYVARMVLLDSTIEVAEHPRVQTRGATVLGGEPR